MTVDTLRGRIALVTGGSRGIGAAISRALAEAGAAVAINYRERRDEATKLADDLRKTGVPVITVQADVLDGQCRFQNGRSRAIRAGAN